MGVGIRRDRGREGDIFPIPIEIQGNLLIYTQD